jgi:hypothetical protein
VRDIHSPTGCPSDSYTPDFAAEIDGPDPIDGRRNFKDGYREASARGLHVLNQAFWVVCLSANPRLAAWQVATALGLSVANEMSDSDIAEICGVTRACISKGRLEFQRANGIEPMPRQKSVKARAVYRETRKKQINDN